MKKKRDLIIALLREEDVSRRLSYLLSFLRERMPHDDFDAIICSPGFDAPINKARTFLFDKNADRGPFLSYILQVPSFDEELHQCLVFRLFSITAQRADKFE